MQPTLTQVPPNYCLSMTAVFQPDLAMRAANAGPAWPVPMTIASNFRDIHVLPDGMISGLWKTLEGMLHMMKT